MVNTIRKGRRHVQKTREWLEADGYLVIDLERSARKVRGHWVGGGDFRGADLLAIVDGTSRALVTAIQVKANKGDLAAGERALADGDWPQWVDLWVIHWPARAKTPLVRALPRDKRYG